MPTSAGLTAPRIAFKFAPSPYIRPPTRWTALVSSTTCSSKSPSVFGFVSIIAPTQPDQVDPGAPAAGAGGPYRLSIGSSGTVSGCSDRNGSGVDLATCLRAAAYSTFLGFASDRVVMK